MIRFDFRCRLRSEAFKNSISDRIWPEADWKSFIIVTFYCKTISKSIFICQAPFSKNNVLFGAVFCCVWVFFFWHSCGEWWHFISCYCCINILWQQSYVNRMFYIPNAGIECQIFKCNRSIVNSWGFKFIESNVNIPFAVIWWARCVLFLPQNFEAKWL